MDMEGVRPPVRLNTRISAETNDWLEVRSFEMGLTKSALINLAVESYKKEFMTLKDMPEMMRQLYEMKDHLKE